MRLIIHNFLCYKHIEVDFTKFNMAEPILVMAESKESNGIGKSALFQSILWVLWGKIPRLPNTKIKNLDTKDPKIYVYLETEHYEFYREYEKLKRETTTIHTFKVKEKRTHKVSVFKTFEESAEYMQSLLGITYEDFTYLYYFDSYSFLSFFSLPNKIKKTVLENVFKISIFDELLELAKFEYELTTRTEKSVESQIQKDLVLISEYTDLLKSHQKMQKEFELLKQNLQNTTSKKIELIEYIDKAKNMLKDIEKETATLESEYNKIKNETASILQSFKIYKEQYDNLVEITDTCPLCGAKITEQSHITKERNKLKSQLKEIKNQYEKLSVKEKDITESYKAKKDKLKKLRQLINQKQGELNAIIKQEQEYQSMLSKIDQYSNKVQDIQTKLDNLKEQESINRQKSADIKIQKDIQKFWVTGFSQRGIRGLYLQEYLTQLNKYFEYYSTKLLHTPAKLRIKTNSVDIELSDGRRYGHLSTGQRKRVDLAFNFALRKLRPDLVLPFVVFDEVFDGLDREGIYSVIDILASENTSQYTFIITHDSTLKEYFSQYLIIGRTENGEHILKTQTAFN